MQLIFNEVEEQRILYINYVIYLRFFGNTTYCIPRLTSHRYIDIYTKCIMYLDILLHYFQHPHPPMSIFNIRIRGCQKFLIRNIPTADT